LILSLAATCWPALSVASASQEPTNLEETAYFASGVLLAPAEPMLAMLGASSYKFAKGVIEARLNGTTLRLRIGSKQATVSGKTKRVPFPAECIGGIAFIPLKFVAEAFGARISSDKLSGEVTVTHPQNGVLAALPIAKCDALMEAVWCENPKEVKALLDAGCKASAKDPDGYTPLHEAAALGNLEVAKLLLARRASARAKNKFGQTPLDMARNPSLWAYPTEEWSPMDKGVRRGTRRIVWMDFGDSKAIKRLAEMEKLLRKHGAR
jgi:hypothetical protein